MKKSFALCCLLLLTWVAPTLAASSDGRMLIQDVELRRFGNQLNIRVLCDSPPIYQISENLAHKTLIVKFQNASMALPDQKTEKLFNDPMVAGIRFLQEGNDIWAQFLTRKTGLIHEVIESQEPGVFVLSFRESVKVTPLPPPPRPPSQKLLGVRFGMHPPEFSRATLLVTGEVRTLLLQDQEQKVTTIRLSDTHPETGLEVKDYSDNRIRFKEVKTDPNQTFVRIQGLGGAMEVKKTFLQDPPRWVFDFYGEPASEGIEQEVIAEEDEMTEEQKAEQARLEREKRMRQNRNSSLAEAYNLGERFLQQGAYTRAVAVFEQNYKQSMKFKAEHEDPIAPVAIQGLFRAADAIYSMLERNKADNYHQAINAYQTALRVAQQHQFESDLIPRAWFRIGKSYQNMDFFNDANKTYNVLKERYPQSVEAAEANFWKAVNAVSRRDWRQAIHDFREYLRSSPSPRLLHVAHYKMAEAYYNLKDYVKARESFDRARSIDTAYPETDATLLYRMGETYYENADYNTAREVFNVLLEKYPTADFSKLVALRLGDFLRDEGKEEEAIETYKKAITSFSRDIALLGRLRIANIQASRPENEDFRTSLKVYEEIIKRYNDSSFLEEAMLRKGLTLTLFGQYREGIAALEEFSQKFPENVYVEKGVIAENIAENLKGLIDYHFIKQDYLAVVGIYKEFQSTYMRDFRFDSTLFQVGVAYQKLGLFQDSINMYRFLNESNRSPLKELALLQQARALGEQGKTNEAVETTTRFLATHQDSIYDAEARALLAKIYREGREYLEAARVYEEAIEIYTQDKDPIKAEIVPQMAYDLANLYAELGRYNEAARYYNHAMENFFHPVVGKLGEDVPMYIPKSFFLKGEMLYKARRDSEALESLQRALQLYQEETNETIVTHRYWADYQIGLIYQRTGREQRALAIYEKLMALPIAGEQPLWQKLAGESHQALTRQLEYENYLRD